MPGLRSADSITSNAGNDTISGIVDAANATNLTFGPGDNLDAGTGTDILQVSYTGGAAATSGVTLRNIETIRVINANTGDTAQSLDLALSSGYKTLQLQGTSGFKFTNVGAIATVEMSNTNPAAGVATAANRVFDISYGASVVSGTNDTQTLNLSGASTTQNQSFMVNGIENLNINFLTARSGSALDAATETQLTIESGAGAGTGAAGTDTMKAVTINAAVEGVVTLTDTTITKIDASSSTAGVRITASAPANAGAISILGGAGNDVVIADTAGALGTTDTIDGGAGSGDVIVVNAAASIGAGNKISNFEGVVLISENSFDFANLGTNNKIARIDIDLTGNPAPGTVTTSNVAEGTTLVIADNVAAVTHGVKDATNAGTTNALTISLDNTIANTDVDASAAVTAAGIETVTINSTGITATTTPGAVITADAADSNSIATLTLANAAKVNITGDSDLVLTAMTASAVLTAVDASTFTGRLLMTNTASGTAATTISGGTNADNITGRATTDNIAGGAGNDSLVGGGGNDTISGDAGNDTITGGAGNDRLSGADGNDSITAGAGSDSLDGGAGNDTFVITYANLTVADTIIGGDGTDAIRFADAGDTGIDLVTDSSKLTSVTGVERLDLAATASQTVTLNDLAVTNAGGALTVRLANAGAGDDAVNASGVLSSTNRVTVDIAPTITRTAGLTYTVGNGIDVVSLDTENIVDTITVGNVIFLSSADTINAGTGADVMNITDTTNAFSVNTTSATSRFANVKGIETVNLTTGTLAASLTLDDTFVANNSDTNNRFNFAVTGAADNGTLKTTMLVDASAVTGAYGVLSTYTANAAGTGAATLTGGAGNDSLTGGITDDSLVGGAGNDSLAGGSGSDTISGGDNVDRINGGAGADQLTGGSGNDIFTLASGEGTDFITDFSAGDRIILQGNAVAGAINVGSVTAPTSGTYSIATNFVFRLQSSGSDFITTNLRDKVALGSSATAFTTSNAAATVTGGDFDDNIALTTAAGTVNGGLGNDTIAGSAGADTLSGGAGDDTISSGTGDVIDTINGGTGGDTITLAGDTSRDVIEIAAGDAVVTIGGSGNAGTLAGFDTISAWVTGTTAANKDNLALPGTAALATATGGTNGTDSSLTIGGIAVKSHAISAAGLATFDDLDTYAAALAITSDAEAAAVIQYLLQNDIGDAGMTVAFSGTYGAAARGSTSQTWIYSQTDATAGGVGGYSIVNLVGFVAVGVESTESTTNLSVFIS